MDIFKNKSDKLNTDELARYKRHLTLKEIGEEGQIILKNSSVIFIGAGGIGSSALIYTAAAGIGTIGIVDNDYVDISNLQRQIIHSTLEIGNKKTDSAKQTILKLNPNCKINTFDERINTKNILKIIADYDIVCDCSDNFGTRYLINDACIILNKPYIYGAVQGFEGQISVFNLNNKSPNLRDLLPERPRKDIIPSCEDFGILGVNTGLIGILQANEIIKLLTKQGQILDGKILIFNLLNMSMKKLNLNANIKNKSIKDLTSLKDYYETNECSINQIAIKTISSSEFQEIYQNKTNNIMILDVREKNEFEKFSLTGSTSIPLSLLGDELWLKFIRENGKDKKIFTLCQKGFRSEKASEILIKHKIQSISIKGGIDKIKLV
mgnify:CR=1 FL=1